MDFEVAASRSFAHRLARSLNREMNAEQAARAVYAFICKECRESGLKPEIEVRLSPPGEGYSPSSWTVSWESGPYDWGYNASFSCMDALGKLVEPYYSFDVCFYPSED